MRRTYGARARAGLRRTAMTHRRTVACAGLLHTAYVPHDAHPAAYAVACTPAPAANIVFCVKSARLVV